MSTWLYLTCLNHDPPLRSDDESGQHLCDLDDIRQDIRDRDVLIRLYALNGLQGWRASSARFLTDHPTCRIGIVDGNGVDPTMDGDT